MPRKKHKFLKIDEDTHSALARVANTLGIPISTLLKLVAMSIDVVDSGEEVSLLLYPSSFGWRKVKVLELSDVEKVVQRLCIESIEKAKRCEERARQLETEVVELRRRLEELERVYTITQLRSGELRIGAEKCVGDPEFCSAMMFIDVLKRHGLLILAKRYLRGEIDWEELHKYFVCDDTWYAIKRYAPYILAVTETDETSEKQPLCWIL